MESRGQSSFRGQEDGDGSERPLKKARFAWQVKGKHPKNETNPVNTSPGEIQDSASPTPADTNRWDIAKSCSQNSENNETLLGQENPLNHNPSSSSSQYYSYDRSVIEDVRDDRGYNPFKNSAKKSYIESSLEDQYLLQWQTQQMVACCTDNLINRITDRLQTPSSTGSSLRALNMAQFLNHLPGDNTVENEGILMAISAHGLRNNISIPTDDDSDNYEESDDRNIPIFPAHQDETNEVPIPNAEPEAIEDNDDVGYFDDVPESPDEDSHFVQFMNAAIQFAVINKGLTASGT